MSDYRFVMREAVSGNIVCELTAYGVTFGYGLNGYGSFQFTVSMNDPMGDPFFATIPKIHLVAIERNSTLVYVGLIWSRVLDFDTREIIVQGNEWGSIYDRQLLLDYDYTSMAVSLVLDALLGAAGNLPVGSPLVPYGGWVGASITGYFEEASHQKIMQGIQTLANNAADGFEYRWSNSYGAANAMQYHCVVGQPLGLVPTAGAIVELMPPGGGATIHSFVEEQTEGPNQLIAYTADGFRILDASHTYALTPTPLNTYDTISYSSDFSDAQIGQFVLANFALLGGINDRNPSAKVTTMKFIAPTNLDDYGVEGDWMSVIFRNRPDHDGVEDFRRIISRDVTLDRYTGLETLAIVTHHTTVSVYE